MYTVPLRQIVVLLLEEIAGVCTFSTETEIELDVLLPHELVLEQV